MLGSKLGAEPWCDRCGDFKPVKPARKKKVKADDGVIPF
jgi:hypothetical protein